MEFGAGMKSQMLNGENLIFLAIAAIVVIILIVLIRAAIIVNKYFKNFYQHYLVILKYHNKIIENIQAQFKLGKISKNIVWDKIKPDLFAYDKLLQDNPITISQLSQEERAEYSGLLENLNKLLDLMQYEKIKLKQELVDLTTEGVKLISIFVYFKRTKLIFYTKLVEDVNEITKVDLEEKKAKKKEKEQKQEIEKETKSVNKSLTLEETFAKYEKSAEQKSSYEEVYPNKNIATQQNDENNGKSAEILEENNDIKENLEERLIDMGISMDMITEIVYNSILNDFDLDEEKVKSTQLYKFLDSHDDNNDFNRIAIEIMKVLFSTEDEEALSDKTEYNEAIIKYLQNSYKYSEIMIALCKDAVSTFDLSAVNTINDLERYHSQIVSNIPEEEMNTNYDSADLAEYQLKYQKSKIEAQQMRYFDLS